MARKTSELLSCFGVVWEVAKAIVHAVLDLGGSDEDVRRILTDTTLPERIAKVIMGVGDAAVREWPLWRTVKLGTHKFMNEVPPALKAGGYRVSSWADDILAKIALASAETEVDLVRVTVRELGFTKNTTTTKLFARAKELGLELCPAEVGPALRLQYSDQPSGEYLWVGMEPIFASDGYLHVFRVDHDVDRWLYAYYASPADVWGTGNQLVFVRPRK